MANETQIHIIKSGSEAWARWRAKHPDESIDLCGAYFNLAKLKEIDFHNTSIDNVSFHGADLEKAKFREARGTTDFSGARLFKANFHGAKLNKSNFSRAKLIGADFTRAYL